MKRISFIIVLAAIVGVPAVAHHSFARFYLEDQSMSITGELVQFEYTNPHAWVHVDAPDGSGTIRRFAAEWASPTRLGRQGITKDTLKPGDTVVVTGSPGREAGAYKMHLKGIQRPADGWHWRGGRDRR